MKCKKCQIHNQCMQYNTIWKCSTTTTKDLEYVREHYLFLSRVWQGSKKIKMHLSSGQVSFLFSLSNFLLYLSFGQVGKNWKNKCGLSLVQKNVQRDYVLNVYLSFGWVNTNSHLSHRQNNLSRTSGHRVLCTLFDIFHFILLWNLLKF